MHTDDEEQAHTATVCGAAKPVAAATWGARVDTRRGVAVAEPCLALCGAGTAWSQSEASHADGARSAPSMCKLVAVVPSDMAAEMGKAWQTASCCTCCRR